MDMLLHPCGINASAAAGPWIFRDDTSAGGVKIKVRVDLREFAELLVKNNIVGGAGAIKDGDASFEFAHGGFTHEAAKRCDAGTARDADEMFVRFVDRKKAAGGRNDEHAI